MTRTRKIEYAFQLKARPLIVSADEGPCLFVDRRYNRKTKVYTDTGHYRMSDNLRRKIDPVIYCRDGESDFFKGGDIIPEAKVWAFVRGGDSEKDVIIGVQFLKWGGNKAKGFVQQGYGNALMRFLYESGMTQRGYYK